MARRIILASQSPRRKELLQQVGLTFDIVVADIDESVQANEPADAYVLRVASDKALTVARQYPDAIVIAADTTVSIDDQILTKPLDLQDAIRMWRLLSGRTHTVKTTVVMCCSNKIWHDTVTTQVDFKDLTDTEMFAYWQTGEPQDKAGGYAIQGRAAAWVKRIEGSYSNVVGLPLYETLQLFAQAQHAPTLN